ncbi:MAG TPA: FHA domain-containing protein, partial [Beutenbergiaceae bacterium]|nr:FHA domain-containing protein [Beutenbergiaceae bacterium]
MSELLVTILRLGYLALLWIFVLTAIGVLRRDIYGTRIFARGSVHPAKSAPAPSRPQQQPRPRGVPTRLHVTGGRMSGTSMALGTTSITIGRDPP